jgi:hypothetical protein
MDTSSKAGFGKGASWEGFVVEQIANELPAGATMSFYRTAAGAERG